MEFDSFYVKFGGINDDGFHNAIVIVGFSDDSGLPRGDIEIPVRLKASLDGSLRELREQAKALALERLREATLLLEQFSTDQLHSKAQDACAERGARIAASFQQDLATKLAGGA